MKKKLKAKIFLDVGRAYKVGDPIPHGYIDRQEWARVHMRAGIKQTLCQKCRKYFFTTENHYHDKS